MQILGIDPGFRNLGMVIIEWSPKVRRVIWHWAVTTKSSQTDGARWAAILGALSAAIGHHACPDVIACEEMTGVRHGHNARGTTTGNTDELLEVQGAIRALALTHSRELVLVRSQSSYAAMGVRMPSKPGETRYQRQKRQKEANISAARLWFSGAELLTEHEADACLHAGAVALGKGG